MNFLKKWLKLLESCWERNKRLAPCRLLPEFFFFFFCVPPSVRPFKWAHLHDNWFTKKIFSSGPVKPNEINLEHYENGQIILKGFSTFCSICKWGRWSSSKMAEFTGKTLRCWWRALMSFHERNASSLFFHSKDGDIRQRRCHRFVNSSRGRIKVVKKSKETRTLFQLNFFFKFTNRFRTPRMHL